MLDALALFEKSALTDMLEDRQGWNGIFINYHEPFVERLWRQWGTYRVFLHRIHPCNAEDALLHPHPWASAMKVVEGRYEMGVGYGAGDTPPPIAAKLVLNQGSSYEMTERDSWHYVRPLDRTALSIMITAPSWGRNSPGTGLPLPPLTDEQRERIFEAFGRYYH